MNSQQQNLINISKLALFGTELLGPDGITHLHRVTNDTTYAIDTIVSITAANIERGALIVRFEIPSADTRYTETSTVVINYKDNGSEMYVGI